MTISPSSPVNGQNQGAESRSRLIQRTNNCVMVAGPPCLLITLSPNHFIAKVWPLCECGQMTQYQRPTSAKRTTYSTPPTMCMMVLLLRSNGIDTRYGITETKNASIQYWKIRRQVTLVSASPTAAARGPGSVPQTASSCAGPVLPGWPGASRSGMLLIWRPHANCAPSGPRRP